MIASGWRRLSGLKRWATSVRCWQPRENCRLRVEVQTLLHHLLAIARNHPNRIALRCSTEAVSYEEFGARILRTAAHLRFLRVGEGDRVLICGGNTLAIP